MREGVDRGGWWYYGGGNRTDSVLREAERAIPLLEAVGDHASLAKAWRLQEVRNLPHYATSALYGPTPVDLAIERCNQVLEQEPGDLRAEGIVRCTLAQLHAMAGRFDEARVFYRRGRDIFTQLGGRLLIASTSLDSGRVELMAGDPKAAIAELAPDHDALEQMGERYLRSTIAGLLARAEEDAGLFDAADGHCQTCEELSAPDDIEAQALWRGVRARLLARGGAIGAASERAREAVELTRTTDGLVMQGGALLDLSLVLAFAGDGEKAAAAAAEAADLFDRKGNVVGLKVARAIVAKPTASMSAFEVSPADAISRPG